jgi:serine/threonine-protein kinase
MKQSSFLAGRYELIERVGHGGEAEVFRARDAATGHEVAVRLALAGVGSPSWQAPALPEFHPGWVRFLDSGNDEARGPYQVFELLRGDTLQHAVRDSPLPLPAWIAFVRQSLDAVGALHAAGWVHGDLNAENFFRIETEPGRWKLLELPFLRLVPAAPHSAMFGSIHTLAPEQLEGRAADSRSDAYALGCLYYYAASGAYPHAGASSSEVAISRLRFPATPLGERAPTWPAHLGAWVMTLLHREPDRRGALPAARHLLEAAVKAAAERPGAEA